MKKILIGIIILVLMAGCGPRLIYPHLEWLVPWYVSDYISLDRNQKNMLQKRLLKQLDWHCRTQLPAYAETLREIGREISDPDRLITDSKIQHYNNSLLELWKQLMKQIGPDIYDILMTASDAQIDELFDNLSKQNQEFKKEYVDPPIEKLNQNRQKRTHKRLKYWISHITPQQEKMVTLWSTQLVPISEDWIQNREMIQARARQLLANRNSSPEFRSDLLELIVNSDRMRSPAYQAKLETNTNITINFIIRLSQTLSPSQRTHLLKRIESLADDFETLSCDPKEIPKVQGDKNEN
jgi:hypothetical protein